MLRRRNPFVLLGVLLVLMNMLGALVFAQEPDPHGFPHEGWLEAFFSGEQCHFTQTYERHGKQFQDPSRHPMTNSKVRTIIFDDPTCMGADPSVKDNFEARLNSEYMLKTIVQWYGRTHFTKGVRHDLKTLRQPGPRQTGGACIMAPDMPATAIALKFVVENNAITQLHHKWTFDCGAPLPKTSLGVRTAPAKKPAKVAPAWPSAEEMKQNPRYVAGDALQVKECYLLNAPETRMQRHRQILRAGPSFWCVAQSSASMGWTSLAANCGMRPARKRSKH